ncbi:mitochondrial thiamine pyrophosphate carrier-like [Tropilaelaps mercedesae]|uniref:Mitochondrial thiamine pyrophosphate carrier-like n=1 Tax=Tropilaelaps mercedesae TaxID=418985 RepID=A0A1V9XBQ4_9ACAR|nr:mitochondrial thiamine pyrophosphate carrier-like [Tropilaelaps mercedesae]
MSFRGHIMTLAAKKSYISRAEKGRRMRKAKLQLDPITKKCDSAKYSGVKQACQLILREEGVTAFWKGHIPAQVLSVVYGGVQFYGFEYAKNSLYPDKNDLMSNFICGAIGGGTAMSVTHPLDVLRTRLVAQGEPRTYSGIFNAIATMQRREGFGAFYKGYFSNILQVTPYNGACFSFYHFFRKMFEDIPYVPANIVSGAMAGFVGKTMVYPLDLIKKRLQLGRTKRSRQKKRMTEQRLRYDFTGTISVEDYYDDFKLSDRSSVS